MSDRDDVRESPSTAPVRPAEVADAAAIAAIYRPHVTDWIASFEEVPPDAQEMARRMTEQPRLPWFVAIRDDEVVGFGYAARHHPRPAYRWSVSTSIYLAATETRRGTGRAVYSRLLDSLRRLGYVMAYAGISLPNPASVGFHEAVGFRPVGVYRNAGWKHGDWHDVGWWQRELVPPPVAPADPEPWLP